MPIRLISVLAAALLATTSLATAQTAQTAPQPVGDPLAELVERGKIDSSVPGTPRILRGQEIGAGVGAAEEAAVAYRGPYSFGECPENTILTTFGTCARLDR